MRAAIILTTIFVISSMSPFAIADVTETQFEDGSTSYTHTFTGIGSGHAGNLTFPYGASVSQASFNVKGEPSNTVYSNFTNNSDFGGEGVGSWKGQPTGFSSGYRTSVHVENDEVKLIGNPTDQISTLQKVNEISTNGHWNRTGGFAANGDQGFLGSSVKDTLSITGSNSNYRGFVVTHKDELHIMSYTSSSLYTTPTIKRYNSSTGQYIGTANQNAGGCSYSNTQLLYSAYDGTSDGNGVAWTVSYSYRILVKWTITANSWTCQNTWAVSSYYPVGVDVDEDTGRLFMLMYEPSFPNYNRHLYEVDPSSPTSINGTWLLGTRNELGDSSTQAAGLIVDFPKILTNEYYSSRGYHNHFTMNGIFVEHMGKETLQSGSHYGMDQINEMEIGYHCHYYSYCSGQTNKMQTEGKGSPFDLRTPTSSSSIVTSTTTSLTKTISSLQLSAVVGYIPLNTSIDIEISIDGGNTWKTGYAGQNLTFATPGSSLIWKAYLNGTTSETPILDFVTLTYSTTYQTSGYFRLYNYYSGNAPVAVTAWWNSTTPTGTSVQIELQAGGNSYFSYSGDSKSITMTSGTMYIYIRLNGNGQNTPILHDIAFELHTDAPEQVGIDVGADGINEWTTAGVLLGSTTANNNRIVQEFNDLIPGTGSGYIEIPIAVTSQSSGIVILQSFSVTYTINTVNLDISIPEGEILHERAEPYEVVTRHIIGDGSNNYIQSATLSFNAQPASSAPTLEWQAGDIFPTPNDPDDWIEIDQSSWSNENNGILEIHWLFHVKSNFPDQNSVRFTTNCLDNSGTNGYSPASLSSEQGLRANNSFGLGWLKVRDNDGAFTSNDVEDGSWVAAGETIHFQGAMWFADSNDAPKDSAFDVRVAQNGFVHANWRDTSNTNGSFFVSIDLPEIDVEEGLTYEIQTYNERDASKVLPSNSDWSRTYKVDATAPEIKSIHPLEDAYEAADEKQSVRLHVSDSVGDPTTVKLFYWVEADHDLNRNGEADPSEYAMKNVTNNTEADSKWFITSIDHSRNPNMGRVSYYWDGGDRAGNQLHHKLIIDDEDYMHETGPGFDADDATFRTRKDSSAIFTGLEWLDHQDGGAIFAGTSQSISLGLIDANTAIDFEYIDLVFDFEGPDSEVDQQRISYYGITDIFASNSEFINLYSSSKMIQTTNESGMPLILIDFNFDIDWNWPDEEVSDIALEYKERGEEHPTRHIIAEHTFYVENDLVIDASSFLVEDISEPRTGQIADGSRVRNDDRLEFTGRVVYEGSSQPAPEDAAIQVEVFDGEKVWSDGSLGDDGGYSIEVPLASAESLQSSPTRTCLISIAGIPGRGEDMTGQTVSTTLRVIIDDTAPRVVSRALPLNIIDISELSDLTKVPVEFHGTEDADMTGSQQKVHWVMRDSSRTLTLGAGNSILGMQQDGQNVIWTGTVDLTDGGKIVPRVGDWIGFYLTGYDSAGNEFPMVSNSEASPIPEIASDDTDFERQWVQMGGIGPQLKFKTISLDDDHVAPGQDVVITAYVYNAGGATTSQFKVSFYAGNNLVPFDSATLNSIGEDEVIPVNAVWEAEEGVNRIRVQVDPDDVIVEVNNDDNYAEHSVEIVYISNMGWFDFIREQPLIVIFIVLTISILAVVGITANRTAISHHDSDLYDDEWEDDDEYDDDEYEDDEYD
ncbi:MAG: CARDB domain-containing protein [Candidatus Poseidoniaceae archaeon]|nr:CARDB domain-containing protein [Candidatus Poseidoniaceae archaeon]